MEVSGQVCTPAALPSGNEPPMNCRGLGGPHTWSELDWKEKHLTPAKNQALVAQPTTNHFTELSSFAPIYFQRNNLTGGLCYCCLDLMAKRKMLSLPGCPAHNQLLYWEILSHSNLLQKK